MQKYVANHEYDLIVKGCVSRQAMGDLGARGCHGRCGVEGEDATLPPSLLSLSDVENREVGARGSTLSQPP